MIARLPQMPRSVVATGGGAVLSPDNRAMMDVFRHAGFNVTSHFDGGVIDVSFPLTPSDELD